MEQNSIQEGKMTAPAGILLIALFSALGFIIRLFDTLTGRNLEFGILFTVVTALVGVAFLVAAYGLWTLKRWAYPLGSSVYLLNCLMLFFFAVLDFLFPETTLSETTDIIGIIGTLVLTAIILYYLYVKRDLFIY